MEKLFCPRADARPPPSAADKLESPFAKGVVMERLRRGTTEDIAAADDQIWAQVANGRLSNQQEAPQRMTNMSGGRVASDKANAVNNWSQTLNRRGTSNANAEPERSNISIELCRASSSAHACAAAEAKVG